MNTLTIMKNFKINILYEIKKGSWQLDYLKM